MNRTFFHTLSPAGLTAALLSLTVGAALAQTTVRASIANDGAQANGASPFVGAKLSGNGRYAAFRSVATNLVPGGTSGIGAIFVRDLVAGTTELISVDSNGDEATAACNNPQISYDGRFVSFSTTASLDPADTNGVSDIYVRDRQTGTTTLVSVADNESISDGTSDSSAISYDGNTIAFRSEATNLVAGGTGGSQVFVRDLAAGTTKLVSKSFYNPGGGDDTSGFTQISISADGNLVCFASGASDLVANDQSGNISDVFVRDVAAGTTTLVSITDTGLQGGHGSYSGVVSADGRYVAFASGNGFVNGDSNGVEDVFRKDLQTGDVVRVSVDSRNRQGNDASGVTNGWAISISEDGSRVAFPSLATNLVSGDTNGFEDIFLRDIPAGKTTLVSVGLTAVTKRGKTTWVAAPANGASSAVNSGGVSISADGATVLFCSLATNLVTDDTNGVQDVFVRSPLP